MTSVVINDDDCGLLSLCKKKSRGSGRPSKVECYPEVVNIVQSFIEQSSAAAHLRRSNACVTAVCAREENEWVLWFLFWVSRRVGHVTCSCRMIVCMTMI